MVKKKVEAAFKATYQRFKFDRNKF